ncbi:Cuticlin-3 [Trichinella spiralis]|uniref:Cuticlin-3 n=1 Tax=Trichinella spiralis TaxID=6334 RepID=A0ABR3KLA7_TRISP
MHHRRRSNIPFFYTRPKRPCVTRQRLPSTKASVLKMLLDDREIVTVFQDLSLLQQSLSGTSFLIQKMFTFKMSFFINLTILLTFTTIHGVIIDNLIIGEPEVECGTDSMLAAEQTELTTKLRKFLYHTLTVMFEDKELRHQQAYS